LLRCCPDIRVLATSRETLNTPGEVVLRVRPLTLPDQDVQTALMGVQRYDAVTLFEQRAMAAVPDFVLTDDNLDAVVQICRHLDGLPLAIELAAARLRAMSVDQILQRLTDRYCFLTLGNRGAPSRQKTLQLCVDWSHDLCTPTERLIWARLSVFAGSFDLEAAEGVCGTDLTPTELLDTLTSLVLKSILVRDEQDAVVRFRMLDTLREYGRQKAIATGVYEKIRSQHHDYYLRLVRDAEADWISPRQLNWIARIGREQPNWREAMEFALSDPTMADSDSALQFAASLFPFWLSRNLLSEGRYWLDRALTNRPAHPTPDRVKVLYADSVLAGVQGDLQAGSVLVEAGHKLMAEMADPVSNARVAHADGILALYSGDASRACALLEEALDVFRECSDLSVQCWILMMLGMAQEMNGNPPRAIECHEQVLAITRPRGETVFQSYSLWAMGVAAFRHGELDRATELLQECLRLGRAVDQPLVTAVCLEGFAWIAAEQRHPERAATLLAAADSLSATVGSSPLLYKELLVHHTNCDDYAQLTLDDATLKTTRRTGALLTTRESIAYALGEDATAARSGRRAQTSSGTEGFTRP
jgi:predicted ATPase